MADPDGLFGTTWRFSAAWGARPHDCTLNGIQARCHGGCCYSRGGRYWPARASDRDDGRCAWLGPTGCTMAPEQKPVTCLLYPFRVNKQGTVVLHNWTTTKRSVCQGNHGVGPPAIVALAGSLRALLGDEVYEQVRESVLDGRDIVVDVPPAVAAALETEALLEQANIPPIPRKA